MNIAILKEIIKNLPDNMEVLVGSEGDLEFNVSPATEIKVTNVLWSENGVKQEPFSEEDCLVIK